MDDERMVLIKRDVPVRVVEKGRLKTNSWSIFKGEYDSLFRIDLRPKVFSLQIKEGLITNDSARVSGKFLSLQELKVIENIF